jgi:hypothetical protein
MSDATSLRALCVELVKADTEAEVISLLRRAGLWEDPKLWRWLGDEEFNYSSVGNQQSRAEQAIIEKLINSIDSKLIAAARIAGDLPKTGDAPQAPDVPKTIKEARQRYFGERLKDVEALSHSITVSATGARPREGTGRPCFTIVDDGEGQTPKAMPDTILSLYKGNKDRIKFVQGKFNMGGTGVLEFCGLERNLHLVVSKRQPDLISDPPADPADADWSFTIIRREDPTDGKSSRFTYLAPLGSRRHPGRGALLHFAAETLPVFPEKNKAYVREATWGTLIKLYEYDAQRFRQSMMLKDSLMYRARLLLPAPALPIRFHECRSNFTGHSGSFDTTMIGLLQTLRDDYDRPKRNNVEWYDKLPFDVDGENFIATLYLFRNKDAADSYRRDEGVIYTYNGQCHATMTKDFFRRKTVKQDYLWHSLLMFIDCSHISTRAHERLFMNSRDRLRDGELRRKIETELEDLVGHHEELRSRASERRKRELSETPKTSESMAKVIEALLRRNPTLAALLGQGLRIKNPHKPETAGLGIAGFIGRHFPTRFHFRALRPGAALTREAHLNSHARITFETDAANDYFKRDDQPGEFRLTRLREGKPEPATNYQAPRLHNGFAHLSLVLPEDTREGDELTFRAQVSDPSRIEPFDNVFTLKVKAERLTPAGGKGVSGGAGSEPGGDRGSKEEGDRQTRDSLLDIPDPVEVYEKDWHGHEPKFDKFTVVRIKEPPSGGGYDYYINIDNVHLQTFLKAQPKFAIGIKLRFKVGMTIVALALLHQEQLRRKDGAAEDMPDEKVDVRDRVAQVTSALAPFLLPMIESISELDEDSEYLSESAGEAA